MCLALLVSLSLCPPWRPGWWPHMWPWVGITRQLMFMELCTCRVYSNQCLTSRITNRARLD